MADNRWVLNTVCDAYTGGDYSDPTIAPVLVLGHSLGSSHIMWDDLIPLLTDCFTVIRYDLPGHGGSAPAPIHEPLTMGLLLDALDRTLESLKVERFHLAGLSIGGLVTLAGAQRWGTGKAPRLISAIPMASGAQNGTYEMWQERASLVRQKGTEVLTDATMERWFTPEFYAEHPEKVAQIRQVFDSCSNEGYAQCCEILSTTDLSDHMGDIGVPLAIINGSDDAGFDDAAANALAQKASGAPVVTTFHISNTRHMCAMERPEWVATQIRAKSYAHLPVQ